MKAIIAAAGYGTRMLPVTKSIPKELLPVWNKPVIQYIVEWLVGAGIQNIIVITSQGKQAIEDYFDKNYELEETLKEKWKIAFLEEINKPKEMANYCFVKQKKQLWFAHAIMEARHRIESGFFFLTVWDTIFDQQIFIEMIAMHHQTKSAIVACKRVDHDQVSKYGIVEHDDQWRISSMKEKPMPTETTSDVAMIGMYILPTSLFPLIEQLPMDPVLWELTLPDAMRELMKTDSIYAYITTYQRRDVGNPKDWLKACNELIERI